MWQPIRGQLHCFYRLRAGAVTTRRQRHAGPDRTRRRLSRVAQTLRRLIEPHVRVLGTTALPRVRFHDLRYAHASTCWRLAYTQGRQRTART